MGEWDAVKFRKKAQRDVCLILYPVPLPQTKSLFKTTIGLRKGGGGGEKQYKTCIFHSGGL